MQLFFLKQFFISKQKFVLKIWLILSFFQLKNKEKQIEDLQSAVLCNPSSLRSYNNSKIRNMVGEIDSVISKKFHVEKELAGKFTFFATKVKVWKDVREKF